MFKKSFPHLSQHDSVDCGPCCVQIISKYYGADYTLAQLRESCNIGKSGVSVLGICRGAEKIGYSTTVVKISFDEFKDKVQLPCIVHWNQNHFLVVYKITSKYVYISDPGSSKNKMLIEDFKNHWISDFDKDNSFGVVVILDPPPQFRDLPIEDSVDTKKLGLKYFLGHLLLHRRLLIQVILGLFSVTLLTFFFPFLTQTLIDSGIRGGDLHLIYIIVIAQLAFYAGKFSIEFLQGWILQYIGSRINISMVSKFLANIMDMPIKFFDTKLSGDLLQRIDDHKRIEKFLTSRALTLFFEIILFITFLSVIFYYSVTLGLVFLTGTIIYLIWTFLFIRKKKIWDFKRFIELSKTQSKQIEMINGMQDIKLHNAQEQKKWEWQEIQVRLFNVNMKLLTYGQTQKLGARFINNIKNVLITLLAAIAVVNGEMSFGQLIAIQFVIGELNGPLFSFVDFLQSYEEAKLSMGRVGEIGNNNETETKTDFKPVSFDNGTIHINNVDFQYGGSHFFKVLKNINMVIPQGKTTAIVGLSGSGKTTLIKLLMKFYEPSNGSIEVGGNPLSTIDQTQWRSLIGSVLQDGYIFSDTIERNIALGFQEIDDERLQHAITVANLQEFIASLPLGFNTKIGPEGMGISQGQKQRILIARSVYKNPSYLFFDEATNALDANNERTIINRLDEFFKNRTVVVVAHRLSTVRNADNIYVIENGEILESGNHEELVEKQGAYFILIKNQLEIGA